MTSQEACKSHIISVIMVRLTIVQFPTCPDQHGMCRLYGLESPNEGGSVDRGAQQRGGLRIALSRR
jgi:hypothetical protein